MQCRYLIHSSWSNVVIRPGSHVATNGHISLASFNLEQILLFSLNFITLTYWKRTGQFFGGNSGLSPNLGLSDVSSWLDSCSAFLEGCHGSDVTFSHFTSGGPRLQFVLLLVTALVTEQILVVSALLSLWS